MLGSPGSCAAGSVRPARAFRQADAPVSSLNPPSPAGRACRLDRQGRVQRDVVDTAGHRRYDAARVRGRPGPPACAPSHACLACMAWVNTCVGASVAPVSAHRRHAGAAAWRGRLPWLCAGPPWLCAGPPGPGGCMRCQAAESACLLPRAGAQPAPWRPAHITSWLPACSAAARRAPRARGGPLPGAGALPHALRATTRARAPRSVPRAARRGLCERGRAVDAAGAERVRGVDAGPVLRRDLLRWHAPGRACAGPRDV